jgi:2-dehydro-3-deoxygalactonokinase
MTTVPVMIGVDWGTSNFRAWLMDAAAQPIDSVTSPEGLLKVPGRDFSASLSRACGSWLDRWPALPVLMCGMVGSRQGWREAAYLKGDAGAGDLAEATLAIRPSLWDVRIVPGLQSTAYDGSPDVMRGEETKLIGAVAIGAPKDGLFCMPGTHSKWVELRDGRICSITTFMTGELFALLRGNSILTGLIEAEGEVACDVAARAFQSGLRMGQEGGAIAHKLFSIRAQALTGTGSGATLEMLSGLLIGSEIATIHPKIVDKEVILIASEGVANQYRTALHQSGIEAPVVNGDEACRAGLSVIAREVPEWKVAV